MFSPNLYGTFLGEKNIIQKIQGGGGKNMIFLENIYTPALNLYKPCLPTRINPKYVHALYVICVASIFSNTRSGRPFQVDGVKILREWSYEAFQNEMKRWKDEKMKRWKEMLRMSWNKRMCNNILWHFCKVIH